MANNAQSGAGGSTRTGVAFLRGRGIPWFQKDIAKGSLCQFETTQNSNIGHLQGV
jgi:hypothetical protein